MSKESTEPTQGELEVALTKAKRSVGRPTKYRAEFSEALPYLFDEGQSIVEVCVVLGISEDTFHRWKKEHKPFSESYKKGLVKSQAWWERLGRSGSTGNKVNPPMWIFNMKNRFSWTDRHEVLSTTADLTPELADQQRAAYKTRMEAYRKKQENELADKNKKKAKKKK